MNETMKQKKLVLWCVYDTLGVFGIYNSFFYFVLTELLFFIVLMIYCFFYMEDR